MGEKNNITILIAPLDWGLGHATRCIPLIHFLLKMGCKVIIAAEGTQEKLLKNEFPSLLFVHLPGYRINYSRYKRFFLLKIVFQLPKIFSAVKNEKEWLQRFAEKNKISAVISDNRYGLYHSKVISVFITHQLRIKAPFQIAETILQKINYSYIQKFSSCWVPDEEAWPNLAGALSHPTILPKIPVHYLGGLSRLEMKPEEQKIYDLLIILSGPEPQRTLLERKILNELNTFNGKVLLVRGLPGNNEKISAQSNSVSIENHLSAKELEKMFLCSEYIISRSGYTTVMDIIKLQKKSILIPTPGQTEQEYLAIHLQKQGWCLTVSQKDFSLMNVMEKAKNHTYKLPVLNMETYKKAVENFLTAVNRF